MTEKDFNNHLKEIVQTYDNIQVPNKIISFVVVTDENNLNEDQLAAHNRILELALNSEKPGKHSEAERLKYYSELTSLIESLDN
jgi:Na+/phosphate symporter